MSDDTPTQKLDDIHQSIQKQHKLGNQRIKAWYSDEYSRPEELDTIDRPPHQTLFSRSAELADFAADSLANKEVRLGGPAPAVEMITYGVAVEILLSGIHLKVQPEKFIERLENQNETPSYNECEQILIADLRSDIPSEQLGILVKTLEIVRDQRNNEAHLGYHTFQHSHLDGLILELIYVLLELYSDKDIPESDSIKRSIEEVRGQLPTYSRVVTFDLDELFD